MKNQDKKLKKLNKKLNKKGRVRGVFAQPLTEFANSSPLRGAAYMEPGAKYGW